MRNSMKHAEHDGIKTSRCYCDIKISSRLGTCTDCLQNYRSEKGESRLTNSPTKNVSQVKNKESKPKNSPKLQMFANRKHIFKPTW